MSETSQGQEKSKNSGKKKIFWGVLIVIDAAALLVFGLMLYGAVKQRFSAVAIPETAAEQSDFNGQEDIPLQTQTIAETAPITAPTTPADSKTPAVIQPQPISQPAAQEPSVEQPPQQVPQTAIPPAETKLPKPAVIAQQSDKPLKKPEQPAKQQKTRKITLYYYDMQAKNVALVGGFSSWKPLAMKRLSDKWQITIQVYPGKYQYYFLADGQQRPDPQMPLRKGNRSLLTVEPE